MSHAHQKLEGCQPVQLLSSLEGVTHHSSQEAHPAEAGVPQICVAPLAVPPCVRVQLAHERLRYELRQERAGTRLLPAPAAKVKAARAL